MPSALAAASWASFSLTFSNVESICPGEFGKLTSCTVSKVDPFAVTGVRTPDGSCESSVSLSDMEGRGSGWGEGEALVRFILGVSCSLRRAGGGI